jgi:hypothetical protein
MEVIDMRKYDYQRMTKALTYTESGETRELLVLLEMDWSHAQVLQFFRERDKWRETSVTKVQPVKVTTKEDEVPVYKIVETVNDQVTDSVTTKEPAAAKKK